METLADVEKELAVSTIRCYGQQVWPFLRWYVTNKKDFGGESMALRPGAKMLRMLVKSVFYGFTNLFRRPVSYIFFSDTSERKKVGSLYYDKSLDYLASRLPDSLYFELPLPVHFRRQEIPTRNIVSKVPLYFLVKFLSLFLFNLKIENEELLIRVLKILKIELDYRTIIRLHRAQYLVGKLLIMIYRPKKFILQCYYTNMGYVKAFRDSKRDVIEVQHGLIGKNHEAYNIPVPLDPHYFPNILLTYGTGVQSLFTEENYFIDPAKVIPVGSFYLDYIIHHPKNDARFDALKQEYDVVFAVTSQKFIEEELIAFLKSAGQLDPGILYVFIPREIQHNYNALFQENKNIVLVDWLNTYEIIAASDYHGTVNSTCAIEAPALGVPNVLINIRGLSTASFAGALDDPTITKIANTPEELVKIIRSFEKIPKAAIATSNERNFRGNYTGNIDRLIQSEVFSV